MPTPPRLALAIAILAIPASAAWKAGTARADITPTEPIWMAGFGSRTKPSEGVRQKIWVKALALEDETGAKSVLVTSDLLGFNSEMADYVSRHARAKFGLTRDRLALNSSHTHSGPVTGTLLRPAYPFDAAEEAVVKRYTAKLLDLVVGAIGDSLAGLKPATLAFGQGNAGFATNRRRVTMALRHLPGPVDHDVPVLAVRGADGKLAAVVFGYACHETSLSDYQINGDWPGFAQAAIEKAQPGAMAMFVTGAGADANPLPRRTVQLSEHYGDIMGEAVSQVLAGRMLAVGGPLKTAFGTTDLGFTQIPDRGELDRRIAAEKGDTSARRYAQLLLDRLKADGRLRDKYPYPVQVWRFGSTFKMIIMGGEVVVDYALRLKAAYGWADTWVAGYSNDVFAYIPSLRVLKEGGYEGGGAMVPYGQPGPFDEAVEESIMRKVGELMAAVK